MRAWIAVTLAWSCLAVAAPDVRRTVDSLPALGTIAIGRNVIDVRGNVSAKQKQAVLLVAEQVVLDVQRRFTRKRTTPDAAITLCVLSDDEHYRAVASAAFGDVPSDLGFYRPDHRVAIANLGNSIGNLRHELTHPLLGDDFPEIPAWLNEGTAALYGTAKWNRDHFDFLVNYRLKDLQRAIKAGTLPTIAALARSTDADVRGADAGMYYAMSRYVLLYVDRKGKLSQLYAELRAAKDTDAQQAILTKYVADKPFVAWAKQLRY